MVKYETRRYSESQTIHFQQLKINMEGLYASNCCFSYFHVVVKLIAPSTLTGSFTLKPWVL